MAGAIVATVVVLAAALGEVALLYTGSTSVAGAKSPLRFINGGDYASASAEGFVTVTYPSTPQVAFTAAIKGADGAEGTYLLDMVELEALTNSTSTWTVQLNVVTALVGTGINAAWIFDCTTAPTGVPDTGTALASGTDAAGDVWAVFAPSCAGTEESHALTTAGTGTALTLPTLAYGTSVLYLSFGVAVSSAGATTTTPATVVLTVVSP